MVNEDSSKILNLTFSAFDEPYRETGMGPARGQLAWGSMFI